jgi:lipoprotein-anchoring transpeptidase ErfK/SrfK
VSARTQEVLQLERMVVAHAGPSATARPVARVAATTPLTSAPSVLPVIGRRRGGDGAEWLRVRLPIRPNGTTGWVRANAGNILTTPWQIIIRRSARRAEVLEAGTRRATFPVIVGRRSTPTPLGTFFVVETLHVGRHVEGPWALATSAYSDVLHEFAGGNGQVALHGRVGLPEPLGTFASHGCVRFGNAAITWIARHVGPGARIVIEP